MLRMHVVTGLDVNSRGTGRQSSLHSRNILRADPLEGLYGFLGDRGDRNVSNGFKKAVNEIQREPDSQGKEQGKLHFPTHHYYVFKHYI